LIQQKILNPLQLSGTGIHLNEGQLSLLTKGYNKNGNPTPHWDLNLFAAAGGLNSSSQDMLTYLNYNLQEPDTACRLAHQISQVNGEKMAYGWFVRKTKQGNTMYWHSASTFGNTAFAAFIKEKNCSLIVLANSATNVEYIAIALLNYLQK
jgi:CubicO group peptidase (beta-lactamase class C family)